MRLFLFSNGLFSFARMFSGATFVVILVGQGISLQTIAIAKTAQLWTSALLMVPTGVIADRFGRKRAVQIACFAAIAYYCLLLLAKPWSIITGEVMNGVALAFYSGAFESWLFSKRSADPDSREAHEAAHLISVSNEISYLMMMVAGFIGAVYPSSAFALSGAIMGITLVLFSTQTERLHAVSNDRFGPLKRAVSTLFQNTAALRVAVALIAILASMQPVYGFWQAFFSEGFSGSFKTTDLGIIFCGFMGVQYLVSWIIRTRVLTRAIHFDRVAAVTLFLGAVSFAATLGFARLHQFLFSVLCFCLFQGCIAASASLVKAQLSIVLPKDVQATGLSVIDLAVRALGGLLIIGLTGFIPGTWATGQRWGVTLAILVLASAILSIQFTQGRRYLSRRA